MEIDQEDFKLWWKFQGMQDNVEYHCSIDSVKASFGENDILIVDEADSFVYD